MSGQPAALSARLAELRKSLTDDEMEFLLPVISAMRSTIVEDIPADSDLVTPSFRRAFSRRLRVFHALHSPEEVLTKKSFEFAFREAMEADGAHKVDLGNDPTFPGSDAVVDGEVGFSLKTEAAKGIRPGRIVISKLMESIWTKSCKCTEDFLAGLHNITTHIGKYDRILTLRTFGRLRTGTVRYELWEIPRELFLRVQDAKLEDFTGMTKANGNSLKVYKDGELAFQVVFDGSDQKVTITKLNTKFCRRLGTWTLNGSST